MPRLSRPVLVGAALTLIVLIGSGGFAARQAAGAAQPLPGTKLSSSDVRTLVSAAGSCPELTAARLAGQVMAASKFGSEPVEGMRDGGASGVAGLTTDQWGKYAPWPGAKPGDRVASITALAHAMCALIGQARAVQLTEDPWKLALAGFRTGMDQVVAAGAVPDSAHDYVDSVDRYAAWYALQPSLGGSPASPAPTAPGAGDGQAVTVPDAYVKEIVAAGKTCTEFPPALVAAQIMATSGFDPGKLGAAGEEGIAQFPPARWTTEGHTPWDPAAAIPALGKAMCSLIGKNNGQYATALAAFARGGSPAASLAQAVSGYQTTYAKDARLSATGAPAPVGTTGPAAVIVTPHATATSKATTKPAVTQRAGQPAIKAANASASASGPFFIRNHALQMCADLPGYGTVPDQSPLTEYPCDTGGSDNQEFKFVPDGSDSAGYQHYLIENTTDTGHCVDPLGTGSVASGAALNDRLCFARTDNQDFRLEYKYTSGGFEYYWLRNTASNLCLGVKGAKTGTNDTPLDLETCKTGDDQEWALIKKAEF